MTSAMGSEPERRHAQARPAERAAGAEETDAADPAESGEATSERRASGAAEPPRLLIVEDEWFIAVESEIILREAGYAVVGTAVTADEAVSLAERERPHLVLMDIRLRGARDGIEAAVEIRRRFGIGCIFATAHAEPSLRERGAAAEPFAWLVKPYSDRQLLAVVRDALNGLGAAGPNVPPKSV